MKRRQCETCSMYSAPRAMTRHRMIKMHNTVCRGPVEIEFISCCFASFR